MRVVVLMADQDSPDIGEGRSNRREPPHEISPAQPCVDQKGEAIDGDIDGISGATAPEDAYFHLDSLHPNNPLSFPAKTIKL